MCFVPARARLVAYSRAHLAERGSHAGRHLAPSARICGARHPLQGGAVPLACEAHNRLVWQVRLAGASVALLCIDGAGRRATALRSASGVIVSLALLAVGLHFDSQPFGPSLVVAGLLCFHLSMGLGLGSVGYVFNGEIYPTRVRTAGYAQAKIASYVFGYAVMQAYPYAEDAIGEEAVIWSFLGLNIAGGALIYALLPETAGLQLEDVSRLFNEPPGWQGRRWDNAPVALNDADE